MPQDWHLVPAIRTSNAEREALRATYFGPYRMPALRNTMPEVSRMKGDAETKEALTRSGKVMSLRPAKAQGTARSTATLSSATECVVEEGSHKMKVTLPGAYGGSGNAPNPGVLGRAALASCIALGIGMWAARLDVPLDSLKVEVEADYDARGELGVSDDIVAGYTAVRYVIHAESKAPAAKVRAMLDQAIKHSSYVDNFTRAMPVASEIHVNGS
jgi:uncharacterized OsmC-like protein